MTVKPPFPFDRDALEHQFTQRSVRLMSRGKEDNILALSFSGISSDKMEEGVRLVSEALQAARNKQ